MVLFGLFIQDVDPGVNNVLQGTSYTINGTPLIGTMEEPGGGAAGPATSLAAAMALATILGPELQTLAG